MPKIPLAHAMAVVDSLPELSGSRTESSRARAAHAARLAVKGVTRHTLEMTADAVADLAWLKAQTQWPTRKVMQHALAGLRGHVEAKTMTPWGRAALDDLVRASGSTHEEVIDFCLRYALAQVRAQGRIAIDQPGNHNGVNSRPG